MTKTSFIAFLSVTALLIVGAVLTYPGGSTTRPEIGPPFYPDLDAKKIGRAASLTIWSSGKSFTVYKKKDGKDKDTWVVKELSDYPADLGPIRRAVNSLAALRPFEKKTSDPKRLDKLDLEDPTKNGASSKRLTVKDAEGNIIADLVIGRANNDNVIIGQDMVYVRRMGDDQAWLAIGDPKIEKDKLDWTDKRILDIDPARIKRVVIEKKGEKIEIAREKPGDKEFKLVTVPEGRKSRPARQLSQLAELGHDIDIYDVRPMAKVDFKKDAAGKVRLETFDGLVVTMDLARIKKDLWIRIATSVQEEALLKQKPKADSKLKAAAEVRKEAAARAGLFKEWAYLPPVWARRTLDWKLEDLLVPLPKKKDEKKPEKKSDKTPANDGARKDGPKKASTAPAGNDGAKKNDAKDAPAKKQDATPAPKDTPSKNAE